MLGFIVSAIVAAIAIAITAILIPQISYGDDYMNLAVVAVIFGLVNGFVKPIVKLLALPLRMATLGLISFVINAGLLLLVAWLSTTLKYTFTIDTFPPDLVDRYARGRHRRGGDHQRRDHRDRPRRPDLTGRPDQRTRPARDRHRNGAGRPDCPATSRTRCVRSLAATARRPTCWTSRPSIAMQRR